MSAASDGLGVEISAGDPAVLRFRLARPERRNAVDRPMMFAMLAALQQARLTRELRVIVLEAEGDHFCGGFDLVASNAPGEDRRSIGSVKRAVQFGPHQLIHAMWETDIPIVASVRGHAAGFGAQLALVSDFAVVSDTLQLSFPFVRTGFAPDSGTSWLLPRLVGLARAKSILLLGRRVSGADAAAWGLVHEVVPDADLEQTTADLVDELRHAATVSVGLAKGLVHAGLTTDLLAALRAEAAGEELALRTRDFKEGLAAFRERRPAKFEGS